MQTFFASTHPKIAVLCGSSPPRRSCYVEDAELLGSYLAAAPFCLLYGGGAQGLMGRVAQSALDLGGEVFAVTTRFELSQNESHLPVTGLALVDSNGERNQRLFEEAAGFVVMPGGWGTLYELSNLLNDKQVGLLSKPLILLNTAGFWDRLIPLMVHMQAEGFLRPEKMDLFQIVEGPQEAVHLLGKFLR